MMDDRSGNVLPLAAIGVFVMAALAGGAVDMGRAYRVQNRLQNACDAGVLSGRRAVTNNGYDSIAQTQAMNYFNINFDQAQQGTNTTVFLTSSDTAGKAIGGKASTKMPMILMQLFGMASMNISVNCAATMGVGNSDVTMVLDTTGSMSGGISGGGTRIAALRTAMNNFYATIATATQGTNARVRYAIVPFSTAVNVGQILRNRDPDYLVDRWAVSTVIPFNSLTKTLRYKKASIDLNGETITYTASPNSGWAAYTAVAYPDATSCAVALPGATNWAASGSPTITTSNTNNGSGTNYPTTKTAQTEKATFYTCAPSGASYYRYSYVKTRTHNTWVYTTPANDPLQSSNTTTPFSHADHRIALVDTSSFKNFSSVTTNTGSSGSAANGSNITATWNGCIEERRTVNSNAINFSAVTGMSPSGLIDLDIDSAPTSDEATKWAPMWPQVQYYRTSLGVSTSGSPISAPCPSASSLLAPMTGAQMTAAANALNPTGNTYLDVGMLWGARFSSPDGMFGDIVNDPPSNGGNVNRHLVFMTDGDMNTTNGILSTYGIEGIDHRVTTDGSNTTSDANHSLRYRAICDAIKAKGIRIWAIQFDDTMSTLQSDLAYCASPNSAFMAKSAAQLNAAFQEIAKQVGELRVLA
jgi:Flp pilus assembly protein TadG